MEKNRKKAGQKRTSMGTIQRHMMEKKTKVVDCKEEVSKENRVPSISQV